VKDSRHFKVFRLTLRIYMLTNCMSVLKLELMLAALARGGFSDLAMNIR